MNRESKSNTRHLDLGCGANPRNPFRAQELHGIDIAMRSSAKGNEVFFTQANVVLEGIPYGNDFFDSVSAYDFLEHVPRVRCGEKAINFPFVELMNEIHRVLKPGGKLYAVTPMWPRESAFVDPTHVNFITPNSWKYFVEPHSWARMYGLTGRFLLERNENVNFRYEVEPRGGFRGFARTLYCLIRPTLKQHIVWQFSAKKS